MCNARANLTAFNVKFCSKQCFNWPSVGRSVSTCEISGRSKDCRPHEKYVLTGANDEFFFLIGDKDMGTGHRTYQQFNIFTAQYTAKSKEEQDKNRFVIIFFFPSFVLFLLHLRTFFLSSRNFFYSCHSQDSVLFLGTNLNF